MKSVLRRRLTIGEVPINAFKSAMLTGYADLNGGQQKKIAYESKKLQLTMRFCRSY
jgi:hypothetical protein